MPKDHAYTLKPGRPTPGSLNLLRPPIASQAGAGILTRFPSATTLVLTLGADSPCADERGAGNLGLSATELFTLFIATHVSIRTSDTSSNPHESPSPAYGTLSYHAASDSNFLFPPWPLDRPTRPVGSAWVSAAPYRRLTLRKSNCAQVSLAHACRSNKEFESDAASLASVHSLSPVTSSAQDDSTSELLRFL